MFVCMYVFSFRNLLTLSVWQMAIIIKMPRLMIHNWYRSQLDECFGMLLACAHRELGPRRMPCNKTFRLSINWHYTSKNMTQKLQLSSIFQEFISSKPFSLLRPSVHLPVVLPAEFQVHFVDMSPLYYIIYKLTWDEFKDVYTKSLMKEWT
jgi:hypothetical protein